MVNKKLNPLKVALAADAGTECLLSPPAGRILMRGRAARFIPCTALGVIELLQRSGVEMRDKSVVVMGDSNIVGM